MKTSILLIVVILAISALTDTIDPHYNYEMFMTQFERNYTGQQKLHHQQIFNINYVQLLKMQMEGNDVQLNDMLDWNQTQLDNFFNYHPQTLNIPLSSRPLLASSSGLFASLDSFDWRQQDRVTDVKNQGSCGSCWAFASTGQYQSLVAIETNGTKYNLAEQYGVECERVDSNGCSGGYPLTALKLYNKTGIPLQTTYPYQQTAPRYYSNKNIAICNSTDTIKLQSKTLGIQHYANLTTEQIQQDLMDYGPLTVAIYASDRGFQYLGKSGTYACASNLTSSPNHAVPLVGYNTTHWFIKNSWGTNWGDNGYGYLSKTGDCRLKSWVDVMRVNFTNSVTPSPSPTPTPPSPTPTPPTPTPVDPAGLITLTITMSDSYGDGWSGNIIGIKQNGTVFATFGQNFTSGKTSGPINVTIPNQSETSIVVAQRGNWTNQVGFVIKAPNGTVVCQRTAGTTYLSSTIFKIFCPTYNCPKSPTVDYYLTLTDQWGDGWNGNILAFRQNGTINSTFGSLFKAGWSYGPIAVTFQRLKTYEIVVSKLGTWTQEIGYVLRTYEGYVVVQRNPGTKFYGNTILSSFCVDCLNLSPVRQVGFEQTREQDISPQPTTPGGPAQPAAHNRRTHGC